ERLALQNGLTIDRANRDGAIGTRLDARRRLGARETGRAEIALAHDAAGGVVLGRLVRAGERAVLAADAGIRQIPHDAGARILFVRFGGTAYHARGLEAVVARRRDGLLNRRERAASVQQTDGAPELSLVEPVHGVAAGDAGFASRASIEIDLERI